MRLFGLDLPGGHGRVGGPDDEYLGALHPDDRHLMREFHETAQRQDSFTSEYRTVWPDGSVHWLRGHGQVVTRGPDGRAQRMISIVADVTERKAAEDHVAFLMREVTHRSKNLLTVIQSIARRTAGSSGSLEDFLKRFEQRLRGLAASHDVLIGNHWQSAPLAELLRQQLNPFVDLQSARLALEGPEVLLDADAAQALGLAIHELATNAVKYGSLSLPEGRLQLSWRIDDAVPPRLHLNWVEHGGPAIAPPAQTGFGHVVIQEMARSLDGQVTMQFIPAGLTWSIAIPLTKLGGVI
jgi:two-component sensor histidine kinase